MFDINEINKIELWNTRQTENTDINLVTAESSQLTELNRFCKELSRYAAKIKVTKIDAQSDNSRHLKKPHIRVNSSLDYYAVPLGKELEPFLAALNIDNTEILNSIKKKIESIDKTVNLDLYIARQCPFCPAIVKALLPLCTSKNIHLNIIDAGFYPEISQADNIRSVPCLILNNEFQKEQHRWTGSFKIEEVLDFLTEVDPLNLSAESMEAMLNQGSAGQLAQMMIDKGRVFPKFLKLLASEKWSVRLGAMVTIETIIESDNNLVSDIIPDLWDIFSEADESVQGDILYIIGISGSSDNLAELKKLLKENYPDEVKDAAIEAVDNITNRNN